MSHSETFMINFIKTLMLLNDKTISYKTGQVYRMESLFLYY